ncbi:MULTISPECIES: hypothetical protein [unclassified Stenotrophomonas]|uniref:hypothetical protein n=1 Tax=unclassified Stenotrophomonas TaxID=196198 RepID=UPI000D1770FA|nr:MULTISPECIES: hypothetical protein [unclassified Stenotrophomonas]PTA70113.1 hypothetical protein C9412_19090 [Stenotrophomonas sp. Nf1]PTA76268.1 hypothetical protein C9416_17800 [Stenotrophomonas sp. Nf4]
MPMLALMLLFTGLFGDHGGPAEVAVRQQIQLNETASATPQRDDTASALQLFPLREDRVLRLGCQGRTNGPAERAYVAQLWQRVDGQWRMQRAVSVDATIWQH